MVDARKQRYGGSDIARLLQGVRRLVVARGRAGFDVELGRGLPLDAMAAVLGRGGYLRAPALRSGATFLVGFDEQLWRRALECE